MRVTDGETITPYVHILVFHVPFFIQKYKNLNLYSMQSLKKLNSIKKTRYIRQTNKKDICMEQLLNVANRSEFTHLQE